MKTQNEILTDIYKIIKASPIDALNGGIYKRTRPTDSVKEDCVITLINGVNGKFLQDAALYVKLFYSDLFVGNTYNEDAIKGQALETLLFNLSTTLLKTPGYSFEVSTRETYIESVPEIHQHYAILKINFKLTI